MSIRSNGSRPERETLEKQRTEENSFPMESSVGWLENLSVFFICPHKEGQRTQLWELDDISTVKSIAVCDSTSSKQKHPLRSAYACWYVSMADPVNTYRQLLLEAWASGYHRPHLHCCLCPYYFWERISYTSDWSRTTGLIASMMSSLWDTGEWT